MIAVSNTSPLILLDKIGHLWILGELFNNVIIPPAVDAEWFRPGGYKVPEWIATEQLMPEAQNVANDLHHKLDKGEAEAIGLFSVMNVNFLLLDDLNGRRLAKSMGFPVIGTLGLLISARQKGLINNLGATLEELQKHRFYIADEILKKALLLADEE